MPVEDQAFSVRILKYENLCSMRIEDNSNAQRSEYQADVEPGAPGRPPLMRTDQPANPSRPAPVCTSTGTAVSSLPSAQEAEEWLLLVAETLFLRIPRSKEGSISTDKDLEAHEGLEQEGTRIVQPVLLGKIISYLEYYDPSDSAAFHEALAYATGLSVCVLTWAFLHHLYFYHIQRVGMRLRVAVCHMIYRKALCLSNSATRETGTGQIVNLLSNDVNRFDQVTMFLHFLWVGPLQAVVVTTLLWMEVGISCFAGMVVLILLLLLQSCIGKLFSSLRSETAAYTDDRIRTVSEVITGIRTVKMYTWEKSLADLIARSRRKEVSKILRSSYLRGLNLASFFALSKIMVFVTFITIVLLGNVITASQVFVVVTLFEALQLTGTLHFPMAVEKVSEAVVSIRRIKVW
ncbi:multidrug resistance-associated protein 4-like [Sus scrofa]|uniref:multidrug resistance-associated protein 4-like n=1 Tax=Sus scrofa TaxID=9823 RepID=UPI000A2B2FB7|nr:multidrug resistance-associated protein 4-like [Sus scrofa]